MVYNLRLFRPLPLLMKKHTLTIDLMRGVAAQLVLLQHSFNLLFSIPDNVASMADSHLWYRLISVPTSFGRTAVVVFFVISGYLIGHDVWVRIQNDTFSPKFYTISRLSRLYCVVLPGLFICAALDFAAFHYGQGSSIINANIPFYPATWLSEHTTGAKTFACNLLFLQMAECRQFGTNSSLWSLSNEFFYYAMFPALLLVFFAKTRGGCLVAAAILGFFALEIVRSAAVIDAERPFIYIQGFVIWLMGALSPEIFNRLPKWACKPYMVWNVFLMAAVLRVTNADYFIQNLSVATLVMFVLYYREPLDGVLLKCPAGFKTLITHLSNYSFSLYFIHLPLLFALCSFVPVFGGKLAYNGQDALGYFAVLMLVNGMAFGFYWLFERHYLVLRDFCMRVFGE